MRSPAEAQPLVGKCGLFPAVFRSAVARSCDPKMRESIVTGPAPAIADSLAAPALPATLASAPGGT